MTQAEIKEKIAEWQKRLSNPSVASIPSAVSKINAEIERLQSQIEKEATKEVEDAKEKLDDAETKAEIKEAKDELKEAKKEQEKAEKAIEKIDELKKEVKEIQKKQGGTRDGSGRPKKMEIKKGDWRKIKSGAGKKAKASSPTKMMKPKSVKVEVAKTEKVKTARAFGQVVEYKNDAEFCKQLIKAFKKRRKASKKIGRKTKPVFGVITTSVKNAVSKALHSVSEKEIEKNPKAFLAKAERLEKSAIKFLEDFKAILGSDYKKSEITSEFGDLEKSIKAFVGKFVDKKYSKGGGINSGRDNIFKSQEPHEQRYKRKRDWKEYEK